MREHSYGVSVLAILSAILLFAFLNFVPEKTEEKKPVIKTPELLQQQEDHDTLTEADKAVSDGDVIPIELSYGDYADEGGYAMGSGVLTIKKGGTYYVSGTGSQIIVDAGEENPVHLILSDLTVTSTDGPALYASSCSKLILTLNEGTESTLSDAVQYMSYKGVGKGSIDCRSSVTINGSGSLIINAYNESGIFAKDDVKLVSGDVTLMSMGQGIYAEDKFIMYGGSLDIESEAEGIVSARTGRLDKGYVHIKDGILNIKCPDVGIRAVTEVLFGEDATVFVDSGKEQLVTATRTADREENLAQ